MQPGPRELPPPPAVLPFTDMKVDVHESANGGRDAEQPVSSFERVPTAEPIEVLVDMDAGHGKLKAAKKAAKRRKRCGVTSCAHYCL